MEDSHIKGVIFNIQHYSIHDGPGIRTTVFLKGCPLTCLWCQNPESQARRPVLFYYPEKCTGCGRCLPGCPNNAINYSEEKISTDRRLCEGCGECVLLCPNDARDIMGKEVLPEEVFAQVNQDAIFYQNSNGGVTLSGGDPLAQPDFTFRLAELCHQAGIHVAIETCGFASWETIARVLLNVDLVLYDFKHMQSGLHEAYTGVSNPLILQNARRIYHDLKKSMIARVPIVPGFNASAENLHRTAAFIATELGKDVAVHLLPYHRLGMSKHVYLEAPQRTIDCELPSEEDMAAFTGIFASMGLDAAIGG